MNAELGSPLSGMPHTPRKSWTVWLIGLVLGPVCLMLWLGRGWLAIVYALAAIAVFTGLMFLVPDHIALSYITCLKYGHLSLKSLGIVHGLLIRKQSRLRPWYSRWYAALVLYPLVVVCGFWLVTRFFYRPFDIPSSSNVPSLMVGELVWVDLRAYQQAYPPQIGDMAAFSIPNQPGIYFMKRIIAGPGDHVQISDGIVRVNGQELRQEAITLTLPASHADMAGLTFAREFLPNNRSHLVANISDAEWGDNMSPHIVAPNSYFVLGDNRDNTIDSRFPQMGDIPSVNFKGRVIEGFQNYNFSH